MGDTNNFTKLRELSIVSTGLRCLAAEFEYSRFNDDGLETATSQEQIDCEKSVRMCIELFKQSIDLEPDSPVLHRDYHIHFLKEGIRNLPSSLEVLDASRPWLCYWILHSFELLNEPIPEETKSQVITFLNNCQHPDGGFGGGPGQDPHLAPTYAAVNALCILQCEEAFNIINREKLLRFLFRLKQPNGSFKMHDGSESDVRGVYCAVSVAMLTCLGCEKLTRNTAHWVSRCQTYEGGFGGVPDMEAHGGYTFCGVASLALLKEEKLINVHRLLRWLVNRQVSYEGGFQGRTNKLVDSCYSFWQGASFFMVHNLLRRTVADKENMDFNSWLFNQWALQEYVLICCQAPRGGMIDKPQKTRDFYHTCYALSGLSVAQHYHSGQQIRDKILGHEDNELPYTHPFYNICYPSAASALQYFKCLPFPSVPEATEQESLSGENESEH